MNAGGVPNTCKSNEKPGTCIGKYSGERVSNTLVTCPEVGDNCGKPQLIPQMLRSLDVLN